MNAPKLFFFPLLLLLGVLDTQAQNYTSQADGIWEDAATWSKDQTWGPSTPENPINASVVNITVNHLVAVGSITISGSRTVTVNNTLYVTGDVVMDGSSSLINNGIMIIQGDLRVKGSFNLGTMGTLVVTGDLIIEEGGDVTATSPPYVYGSTWFTGGGEYNGLNFWEYPDSGSTGWTGSGLPGQTLTCADDPALCAFATGTLPIELVYFKSESQAAGVFLMWATAYEENFDRFIVERSADGTHFEAIGEVLGEGSSRSVLYYQFTDTNLDDTFAYYRLKQLDIDGSFEYSSIIKAYNPHRKPDQPLVYPNPVNRGASLYTALPIEEGSYRLIAISSGQVSFEASLGTQATEIAVPEFLPAGVYVLQIISKQANTQCLVKVL